MTTFSASLRVSLVLFDRLFELLILGGQFRESLRIGLAFLPVLLGKLTPILGSAIWVPLVAVTGVVCRFRAPMFLAQLAEPQFSSRPRFFWVGPVLAMRTLALLGVIHFSLEVILLLPPWIGIRNFNTLKCVTELADILRDLTLLTLIVPILPGIRHVT